MRFYSKVETPVFIPPEKVEAALQKALVDGAQLVLAKGNDLMRAATGGRKYGAHIAARTGEPPAVFTGNLVKSGKAEAVQKTKPHHVAAVAKWTAPHAHLMADGFMHKPHRGRTRGKKKKWGKETPAGSVFVPPHPFAKPAGLATLNECGALVKRALEGLK